MRIPKSKTMYVSALLAACLLGGTAVFYQAAHKTITVQDNGKRKEISGFTVGSLGSFLKKEGIPVSQEDHISFPLGSPVENGMVVRIDRVKSVRFMYDGHKTSVQTFANTVQDFLQQEHIVLTAEDQLVQPLTSKVTNGEMIVLHHRKTDVMIKAQEVPFQTIRQRTDHLFEGQKRVLTHGVKGLLDVDTTRVLIDGYQTGQTVSKRVVRQPVNEIVEVGTIPLPTDLASRSDTLGSIVGQLTVFATAYVAGGMTSTGWSANPGVVAVDPSVIPIGTKLYIPGVGTVRAEDTGGGIRGYHIDICLSSADQANAWGGRTVTVYVLSS